MLGALGKGEQPSMAHTPRIQLIAGRPDEALSDAALPYIGPCRQRPEKADAAPARREIRSDKHALVVFGSERGSVLGSKPAIDIVEVAPELLRVRYAEKGAEGDPNDALRLGQVGLGKRANDGHILPPVIGNSEGSGIASYSPVFGAVATNAVPAENGAARCWIVAY